MRHEFTRRQRNGGPHLRASLGILLLVSVLGVAGCGQPEASGVADSPSPVPPATAPADPRLQASAASPVPRPSTESAPARLEPPPAGGGAAVQAHGAWPSACLAPNYHLYGFPGLDLLSKPRGVQTALQWSPDGSKVLFASGAEVYAAAADGTRVERPIDASGPIFLHQSRYVTLPITEISVSPDGERIAYAVCHEYAPNWTNPRDPDVARCRRGAHFGAVNTDDERSCHELREVVRDYPAGPVQLPPGVMFHEVLLWDRASQTTLRLAGGYAPAWSPDGTRLAFLSPYSDAYDPDRKVGYRRRLPGLYVMSADTWQLQSRVRANVARPPRWSPDGRLLAIIEETGAEATLSVVSADGRGRRRLSETRSDPAWSPDGSRIAFVRDASEDSLALYTISPDGTDEQRITTIEGLRHFRGWWDQSVAWSPDGTMLLYGCPTMCVVTLDGQPVGERSLAARHGYSAAWSPDGTRIAVLSLALSGDTGPGVLFTVAPDGTDPQVLVDHDAKHGLLGVGVQVESATVDVAGCTAGSAVPSPAANAGLVRDCEVLLRARPVLAGSVPGALNWSPELPITEWAGVVVDGAPLRVLGLSINWYGPNGRVPPELGGLTQLRDLWLGGLLGGELPPELGELRNLRVLGLNASYFHGPIPPEFGRLAQLEELSLWYTFLSGPIPPELGGMRQLQYLGLRRSFVSGPIPPELGQLASLKGLELGGHWLTGPIPPELGRLTKLRTLILSHNRLTGAIPPELGQMTHLNRLDLRGNRLTGAIPAELSALPGLDELHLGDNQLTGCIPPGLAGWRPAQTDLGDLSLPRCEAAA